MVMDKIALTLLIIGGLNWGSVGLFQFDLVAFACGGGGGPGSPRSFNPGWPAAWWGVFPPVFVPGRGGGNPIVENRSLKRKLWAPV